LQNIQWEENGIYDGDVEITNICEIYKVFVSELQIAQALTVIIGQVVTE
jgi:hypothetical protein